MIELIFLKELTLISAKKNLRDVVYINFIIFYIKTLVMGHFYVMVVMICL